MESNLIAEYENNNTIYIMYEFGAVFSDKATEILLLSIQ